MKFSNRLGQLRKQKNWTQGQLAEKVGTHPNLIGRYELGLAVPSVEMAGKLASVLDTSIDYLAGNTDLNVDYKIMDRFKSLLKLPEDMKDALLRSIDKLISPEKAQLA